MKGGKVLTETNNTTTRKGKRRMRNMKRYFAVTLKNGGKLKLTAFFSESERKSFCDNKENRTRPITMKQWREIPKDMKA